MATFNPQDWEPGYDKFGRPCWCNKVTMRTRPGEGLLPAPPAGGLSAPNGAAPNVPIRENFIPASGKDAQERWKKAVAGAWQEYRSDGSDSKPYWYNTMSGATTWEKPDMNGAGKPPPPPPLPTSPPAPKTPKKAEEPSPSGGAGAAGAAGAAAAAGKKEKESDQWKEKRAASGKKYWYNEKTGGSQYERPNCLRKYR